MKDERPNLVHSLKDNERLNVRFEHDMLSIDRMYAWIAVNKDTGSEGIVHYTVGGYRQPLVAVTLRQISVMRKYAILATKYMEVNVQCVQFVIRSDIAIPEPPPRAKNKPGRPRSFPRPDEETPND